MARRKREPIPLTAGYVEYLRTSDEDVQAPERSQGAQSRLIHEKLITPSGLPYHGRYADTYSGRATHRKEYQRLLADARLGKFSHVGIAFVDRFGRNDVEGLRAFDELCELGIKVRIATYPSLEPEKSDARMIVSVLFAMARFESEKISERVQIGMLEKLYGGGWSWYAPDGWKNVEIPKQELDAVERRQNAKNKHIIVTDPERHQMWREAFMMLLEDKLSLLEIAEALHAKGYRLQTGKPWVVVKPDGRRKRIIKVLSRAFHNWFYTGWVVVDNAWAKIPPKQVRGTWEPVVTTEEFEQGLVILARRNQDKPHRPRHFYLLQYLVYLQKMPDMLIKLNCQTPNANRDRGGVSYYSIPSSNVNFLCHRIDDQVAAHLNGIQIDDNWLPLIREAYLEDVEKYLGGSTWDERKRLEGLLKQIDDAEERTAYLYATERIGQETFDKLASEWKEQRSAIRRSLEVLVRTHSECVATLDDALHLISRVGVLYEGMELQEKRNLLLHLVKRVVISPEGQILRVELRTPFIYLSDLAEGVTSVPQRGQRTKRDNKRTANSSGSAGSKYVTSGTPTDINYEPLVRSAERSSEAHSLINFLATIEYPQHRQLQTLLAQR